MDEMSEAMDKPQGRASDRPPLREMSPEELQEILEAHRKWVESGGKEGKRADLHGTNLRKENLFQANLQEAHLFESDLQEALLNKANLQKADIRKSNLQKANLIKAKLQEANLFGACFKEADLLRAELQGANLAEAKLQGAKLWKARLREVDLQDADLTDATGLLAGQLAGANVSGAKLPEAIDKFEGLKIVEETSKHAQKLFVSMLLGCVYSWLTIATTTDARLLTNFASSPLPIIGTPIPIVGFYVAAPLLLLGLYLYFHLYLQRLWEGLAELPAVFPDGRPLDKRADPWLLIGLVRSHFKLLRDKRPPFSRLQNAISILLAWWVVPVTLFFFWLRYLRRHDLVGTSLHIILLVVSIGFGIMSYLLARATLRGKERKPFIWKKVLKDARTYKRGAVALGIGAIFYLLSFGAIDGLPPNLYTFNGRRPGAPNLKASDIRRVVPRVFEFFGYSPFADLREADVSTKPPNWTGQKEEEIALVKGARLTGADLRYARAFDAFLVNADLRDANLEGAELDYADLRAANLFRANLQRANLQGADLRQADLIFASVRAASLNGANLQGADLRQADLIFASVRAASLNRASLFGANLVNADLQAANLFVANLQRADLSAANLQGAILEWADLRGTDLRYTRGLTQKQIDKACVDKKTLLRVGLKRPKPCPEWLLRT